jgi:anti-sigma B factor antagonist
MPYLQCPECELLIARPQSRTLIENCPRCLARRRQIVKVQIVEEQPASDRPGPVEAGKLRVPGELRIVDVVRGGERTFVLSGELDLASAPLLRSMLGEIATGGTERVRIDLSGLDFIDSTGVHALFGARNICLAHGYEFSLIPGPPSIQRIFEIAGLLTVLPFVEV